VVEEVVSSVDILPTILEYLGIDPQPTVRGRSALPLVFRAREDGPERVAYCEEILTRYGPYDVRGIRTKTHKYIRIFNYEGDLDRKDLFFDLVDDLGETDNLLRRQPDNALVHRQILEARLAEAGRGRAGAVETVEIDKTARDRLKALGYIEDDAP
jgi:arylsulfatase A-like enzyme